MYKDSLETEIMREVSNLVLRGNLKRLYFKGHDDFQVPFALSTSPEAGTRRETKMDELFTGCDKTRCAQMLQLPWGEPGMDIRRGHAGETASQTLFRSTFSSVVPAKAGVSYSLSPLVQSLD